MLESGFFKMVKKRSKKKVSKKKGLPFAKGLTILAFGLIFGAVPAMGSSFLFTLVMFLLGLLVGFFIAEELIA